MQACSRSFSISKALSASSTSQCAGMQPPVKWCATLRSGGPLLKSSPQNLQSLTALGMVVLLQTTCDAPFLPETWPELPRRQPLQPVPHRRREHQNGQREPQRDAPPPERMSFEPLA